MTKRDYARMCRLIRQEVGCEGKPYPIVFRDGFDPPKRGGSSFHYETRGGRTISHPSAYSKRGWSNMVYVASTIRITVGIGWALEALLASEDTREAKRRAVKENWDRIRQSATDGGTAARARFTSEGGIATLPAAN